MNSGETKLSITRSICRRAVTLAAYLILSNGVAMARDLECQRETISMQVSPDNAWIALIQEGWCTDGGLVTTSTNTVRLVQRASTDEIQLAPRREKPEYENDVLVVDYYGHPENRPLVQWLSPRRLQITIPNISGVGPRKNSYQGVDIVVKYEPDDPAVRERWQRERGLAPR
jgi:hypothetical protein